MKNIIIPITFTFLLLSGCSHRIVRTGYNKQNEPLNNCEVVIKRNITIPDADATKVGEIKLGESGFSVTCSEKAAIELLTKEACLIDADLILITKERRPDLWSSCYRCNAEFYKFACIEDKQTYKNDSIYNDVEIIKRVRRDKGFNTTVMLTAFFIGMVSRIIIL